MTEDDTETRVWLKSLFPKPTRTELPTETETSQDPETREFVTELFNRANQD